MKPGDVWTAHSGNKTHLLVRVYAHPGGIHHGFAACGISINTTDWGSGDLVLPVEAQPRPKEEPTCMSCRRWLRYRQDLLVTEPPDSRTDKHGITRYDLRRADGRGEQSTGSCVLHFGVLRV